REGARVADLRRAGGTRGPVTGVRVLDADGSTRELRARLVVGADGLRSVVASRLGLTARLPWPRRLAFQCHVRGLPGVGALGEMHVERDGFVGIADVGGGLTNVAMVAPMKVARRGLAAHGAPAAFLDAWLAKAPQLAPRFARAERVGPVRATGPFAVHARRAWAYGAALVGEAADFFDPFTGEGIYSALRGGELLAPYAADAARGDRRALAGYERARRAEFRGKWMVERLIGLAVAHPLLINRAARVLSRRRDLADLLVGVAGDFVPADQVLNARYVWQLFGARARGARRAGGAGGADPSADASC
ncbi:FAD-dependent monooxygenase, partial [Roseisolibacter sp. H3M3-2]|uniref:NAD(P)/FAD-dependent oxidoreductase n=1 Tax=Roseisolibacter sp. H3M3-2 TaxID=3031323 RepID=UPI0023DC8335